MQSTIIITNGNISIVSHNNPIPANRSKTLGIVATAPELTRRQRLVLFIARVVTVTLTWSFFRAMLDGRSFWLRVLGDVALLYQWALYWRVFDRMK